jgi:hypothetical protein
MIHEKFYMILNFSHVFSEVIPVDSWLLSGKLGINSLGEI